MIRIEWFCVAIACCLIGCTQYVVPTQLYINHAGFHEAVGASLIALAESGYEVDTITPEKIIKTKPEPKSDFFYTLSIDPRAGKVKIEATSLNEYGQVHKDVVKRMRKLKEHIQTTLERRSQKDLALLGKRITQANVFVGTAMPYTDPCEQKATVSGTGRGYAEEGENSARELLKYEAIIKDANVVLIETKSSGISGTKQTLTGKAFRCEKSGASGG